MEIRSSAEWGRIERVYDVHPYPSEEVFIVITDTVALSLAAAAPEEKDPNYLTDSQAPILWHFTTSTIANQGRWLEKVVSEICEDIKPQKIRIVWIPIHMTGAPINYVTDILDIADILLKLKVVGRKTGVSVRTALAKTWLPKHVNQQVKALKLHRLNLAMEVLAFYWFRCRCVDLSKLTLIKLKEGMDVTDETRMEIPGYDGFAFNPRAYRNLISDPLEVSFFTGRRAREILRRVITVHGVEPNWARALVSRDDRERVSIPAVMDNGSRHILSAPQAGGDESHGIMITRVRNQCDFEMGLSDDSSLPDTGLYKYFWEGLNAQSKNQKVKMDPYKRDPISKGNLIPFTVLPTTRGKPVLTYSEKPKESESSKIQENPAEREIQKVIESVTKYYVTCTPAPEPKNRTPVQDRLGPKAAVITSEEEKNEL